MPTERVLPLAKVIDPVLSSPVSPVVPLTVKEDKLVDAADSPASVVDPDTVRLPAESAPDIAAVVDVVFPNTVNELVAPEVPTEMVPPLGTFKVLKFAFVADNVVIFAVPSTFSVLVAPDVPTCAVPPFATVIFATFAAPVSAREAALILCILVEPDIVSPLNPVIKPYTCRELVVPEVPTFAVPPFEIVRSLPIIAPVNEAVVPLTAAKLEDTDTRIFLELYVVENIYYKSELYI